ncbi:hypothetical protein ACFX13_042312 [Malus domestica]
MIREKIIAGYLPNELGLITDLALLHIKSNRFYGTVPHKFNRLKLLFELDLSNNRFVGKFPRVFQQLLELKFLDLSFNEFEWTVPKELFDKDLDSIFINHFPKTCLWCCNQDGLSSTTHLDKGNNFSHTLENVSKWVHNMNEVSEELNEKIRLLSGFSVALRDKIHTDILLQPGDDGPPVPAHRALLAIRLEIFNNILDLDGCKAPPNDTIKLPELNHEELESLLEFLYHGDLSEEKMNKHIYSLSLAADKYGISYLQKLCERHMHKSLSSANALDVLEVADVCSSLTLRENALEYIVKNMHDIIFSAKYDTFALKNPHLCVQISRASLMDDKRNSVVRECY